MEDGFITEDEVVVGSMDKETHQGSHVFAVTKQDMLHTIVQTAYLSCKRRYKKLIILQLRRQMN